MALRNILILIFVLSGISGLNGQSIKGTVAAEQGPLAYASVVLDDKSFAQTDADGAFLFENVALGTHHIVISYLGCKTVEQYVDVTESGGVSLEFIMTPDAHLFDEVVVTGTKTFKRKTKSAIIVNVVDSKTLDNVQACNLSEGLKFQPGLRVETDCQTCNYTQLRMNGLAGGYSQILINGRPIFSPLTGLYGLEQLPVNMIDRIEVIRGGGSSLYGSSAIGGTVNVLTKIPSKNGLSLNSSLQSINGGASDFILNGNGTLVSKNEKSGVSFFLNKRSREAYDHNNDNFSELPELNNTSFGMNAFILPKKNHKLELSLSNLNEYRYGGEMVEGPAHKSQQSEERDHKVWMGSLDYQINFNNENSTLVTYAAWQHTDREHYTGIIPEEEDVDAYKNHFDNPPYGTSVTSTVQGGLQLNHRLGNVLGGENVLTLGAEYLVDDTFDEIMAYNYEIDQVTKDLGLFAQSDWEILPSLNLLSGIRIDKHNLVDRLIASPRLSLLYKYGNYTQVRAGFGTGFRAPQAFDTDMHIAFSGGGISRVALADDLKEETSESYNVSINYDKPTEHWVAGFTLEGFYTRLNDAFILDPIGEDAFGEVFEKKNGQGATVQGVTLELRANYNKKIQLEGGWTLQSSKYDDAVQYIDEVEGTQSFIRTPNAYGFANLSIMPNSRFNANINYVYTGSMIIPHFAGAPNQLVDEMVDTESFHDVSTKIGYTLPLGETDMEVYGGVKNIFNSYQGQFDIGKNRDSNFVYGPSQARTLFLGIKFSL